MINFCLFASFHHFGFFVLSSGLFVKLVFNFVLFFNNVVVFVQELPICSKPIVFCVAELHNRILAQTTVKYSILVY